MLLLRGNDLLTLPVRGKRIPSFKAEASRLFILHRLYFATIRLQSGQVSLALMAGTPAVDAPLLMSSSEMFCHPAMRETCARRGGGRQA